ncbi:hypothetical protein NDU88_000977 [Pleurodeles waltl]|uniref:Uncharacterized protein n=1 Tax=Pleurodeles waltl TaxID=8319 RepID=A0AAV7P2U4_PLEWA|nr:hypothetical protein NDU88_000977 [Pleurodeles waltl]
MRVGAARQELREGSPARQYSGVWGKGFPENCSGLRRSSGCMGPKRLESLFICYLSLCSGMRANWDSVGRCFRTWTQLPVWVLFNGENKLFAYLYHTDALRFILAIPFTTG